MPRLTIFSPAKINLLLAVTGRRADGYHNLVSVAAPLTFGDELTVERMGTSAGVRLSCDHPEVPPGAENLVVRAAEAFRRAIRSDEGIAIELTKRIPMGAGLGGGSSNAASVLRALNQLFDSPLGATDLLSLAAALGSDCPLFLADGPCVMRGRGEHIETLPADAARRLRGTRVLVLRPGFAIATPWAYTRLAAAGDRYIPMAEAEAQLARWLANDAPLSALLRNSFESVAFEKFIALPLLADALRKQPGVDGVLLSGSGSAMFALLDQKADARAAMEAVRDRLGPSAFVVETSIT